MENQETTTSKRSTRKNEGPRQINTGLKGISSRNQNYTPAQVEARKRSKAENEALLKKQRDRDRELVRGIFRFHERPNAKLKFPIRLYKWDDIEQYELIDGETYSIPLGVARHLNKNGWYMVHRHALDSEGNRSMKIGTKVRRFSFQSLEFVDTDDINPVGDLVSIEYDAPISLIK